MTNIGLCGNVIKVYPLTSLTLDDALRTKYHAVSVILGEGLKDSLYSLYSKLLCGLTTEAREHLICVMMVTVIMASARTLLFAVVVMLVIVAVALLTLVVVMLVIVTVALLTVMVVMLVIVAVALLTVVVVMLVIVAVAFLTVMMVMMLMMLMLFLKLMHSGLKSVHLFHSSKYIRSVKLVPRSSNDSSRAIVLSYELNCRLNLIGFRNIGVRKNYA